jgi:16S rRNA (guanine966-N2)-methyltransferase
MKGRARPGSVRIIGGEWRGRRLPVPAVDAVRPSPDRVRETLFNWLQNVVPGRACLDLFGGTGILGFEAASRGARAVTIVDRHPDVVSRLQAARDTLDTGTKVRIVGAEALDWLSECDEQFDVVFLDPPFHQDLVTIASVHLEQRRLLCPCAHVYIEIEADTQPQVPSHWRALRSKRSGHVGYHLYATPTR